VEWRHAFGRACGQGLPYEIADRRPGDIAASYADPARAESELGWRATRSVDDMCADTWRWQSRNPHGYPNSAETPKKQFRAAMIYEKQGDSTKEIAALNEFVQKFSNKSAQAELVIDAKKRIGDAFKKQKNEAGAKKAYAAAADEFDKRNLKPETSPIAAEAAAYSRFELAEYVFADFERIKIGGSGKALANSFVVKKESRKKVNTAHDLGGKEKGGAWPQAV